MLLGEKDRKSSKAESVVHLVSRIFMAALFLTVGYLQVSTWHSAILFPMPGHVAKKF